MVKTTINLDTQVYRELVKEALEKYGTTKTLSRIINEKLRERMGKTPGRANIVKETAGMWSIKETGSEYQHRMRAGWKKRMAKIHD